MKKISLFSLFFFFIILSSATSQTIPCLNFSDYYKSGQNPKIGSDIPVEQHIKALQAIQPFCDCIRIFASSAPLDTVPYLAKAMGFSTVIVGAWLDKNETTNATEIENAIKLAKDGVVDRLIIGSEVILRNDLTSEKLIEYIEYVKQEVPDILVSTADVYDILLTNREVLDVIDYAFINVYPYWEGLHIDCSLYRLHQAYLCIKDAVGTKEVLISETGWPSEGNTMIKAVPSLENLQNYLANVRAWSTYNNVPVYYFSAFDEPWKFSSFTPQEAHWGVMTYDPILDTLIFKGGVEDVLTGPIEIDTSLWDCEFIPNETNTPRVAFDTIPCYGDQNGFVCGYVDGVYPCDFNLVMYIKVNNRWWIKPTYANPITELSCDGSFCIDVVTGSSDRNATEYQLFLVDKEFSPPLIGNKLSLPDSLYEKAILYETITRTPFNRGGIEILDPEVDVNQGDTLWIPVMVKDFQDVLFCQANIITNDGLTFLDFQSNLYTDHLSFDIIDSTSFNFMFDPISGDPLTIPDSSILFEIKIAVSPDLEYCRYINISYTSELILPEIVHFVDSIPKTVPLANPYAGNSRICPLVPIELELEGLEELEPGDTTTVLVAVNDFEQVLAFKIPIITTESIKIHQIESVFLDSNYLYEIIDEDSLIFTYNAPMNQSLYLSDASPLFSFSVTTVDSIASCGIVHFSKDSTALNAFKRISWESKMVPVRVLNDLEICTEFDCQLSLEIEHEDPTCFGGIDGTAFTNVIGAELPLTYQWSNGTSLPDLSNIGEGVYVVTVTDAHGCSSEGEISISEPSPLTLTNLSSTDVECNGNTNGTAIVIAEGGVAPYSYIWSNGHLTNEAQNLSAGDYEVTVTDANECAAILAMTIEEPLALEVTTTAITSPLCFGETNGSINIDVIGGIEPYSYLWSNDSSTNNIQNLSAGDYEVTVTDANECTAILVMTIEEPPVLEVTTTDIVSPLCSGEDNGSIFINVVGGIEPYSYLWSNGSSTNNIQDLSTGDYEVTITDENECTTTLAMTVEEPLVLEVTTTEIVSPLCFEEATGSIIIDVVGGTEPYMYLWSNGVIGNSISGLFPGSYSVTIIDFNDCALSSEFSVGESPDSISVAIDVTSSSGSNDGAINLLVEGGTWPYSFDWYDSTGQISTDEDLNNLGSGFYYCWITDANGCQLLTDTIEVVEKSVGLDGELSTEFYSSIHPNPTSGMVSISIQSPTLEYIKFTIQNSTGLIIPVNISKLNAENYTADLSIYPSGSYYLKIEGDHFLDIHKIILVK